MRIKVTLIFLLILLLTGLPGNSQAKPMHLDSVKVHLPFYGNLNDWSGWNNNGQSRNNVMGTDRYGNISRAFFVDDSFGFFRVPVKNIQVPTFTYTQWVSLREIPDSQGMTVFEGGTDTCKHSLRLFPKGPDSLWMEYRLPFGDADTVLRMPVRMPLASWHHLTALRSKDSVFLYFDVLFNAGFYVPGKVCHTGDWLYYGAALDSTRGLMGSLDEIRVFSENIEPALLFEIVTGERLWLVKTVEPMFHVYPNPGKDFWTFKARKNIKSLVIRNQQGQEVHRINGIGNLALDLRLRLPSGIYFLEMEFEDSDIDLQRLQVY